MSTGARDYCHATTISSTTASVPRKDQRRHRGFYEVTRRGVPDRHFYCGNGTTYGAVHTEVKHNVGYWDQADECIRGILEYGTRAPAGDGKATVTRKVGSRKAIVVYKISTDEILSAYPAWADSPAARDQCGRW